MMQGNQTILHPPEPGSTQSQAASGRASERKTHNFTFDKSYWSAGPRDEPGYCSQETLYNDLGIELLEHGFSGFNACILACEQTAISLPSCTLIGECDGTTQTDRRVRPIVFLLSGGPFIDSRPPQGSGKSYRSVPMELSPHPVA